LTLSLELNQLKTYPVERLLCAKSGHSLKRSNAGIKVSRFLVFAVYVGDVNANAPVGVCLLLLGKNTLKV
jgi:hypothetical protein